MDNVSDPDRMPTRRFQADPGTIRMIIDYPFDEADRFPADDVRRVHELKRPARRRGHHRLAAALPLRGPQGRPVDPHRHQLPARTRPAQPGHPQPDDGGQAPRQDPAREPPQRADRHAPRGAAPRLRRHQRHRRRPRPARRRAGADPGPRPGPPHPGRPGNANGVRRLLWSAARPIAFPSHPDFDPNGRGVALKLSELDTVLGAVEQAAQDKVGRYEVPRRDILTVKKIANPLKIGIMHEAAFVLSREWPDLLTRKAGTAPRSPSAAAARLDRRGAAWPARAGAEPAHRLLRGPGRQGMAAGRAPGRAAQARQDPRRPRAPQPGAADPGGVRPRVRPGGRDLPHPAAAGAHRPVGARAGRRRSAATPGAVWRRPRTSPPSWTGTRRPLAWTTTPTGR